MIPEFMENDMIMFYRYLDKANVYFEFGAGGSTYQASIRKNIEKIYTVESDIEWVNKLKENIEINKINFLYVEMNTKPNTWGYPGNDCSNIQKINYSNQIRNINDEECKNIDLILIDGRFRVACCLKCFNLINDNCLIVFDDFLDRSEYHIILNYYNIIDKTIDNRMVILQKNKNILNIPDEIIFKYELISR